MTFCQVNFISHCDVGAFSCLVMLCQIDINGRVCIIVNSKAVIFETEPKTLVWI